MNFYSKFFHNLFWNHCNIFTIFICMHNMLNLKIEVSACAAVDEHSIGNVLTNEKMITATVNQLATSVQADEVGRHLKSKHRFYDGRFLRGQFAKDRSLFQRSFPLCSHIAYRVLSSRSVPSKLNCMSLAIGTGIRRGARRLHPARPR